MFVHFVNLSSRTIDRNRIKKKPKMPKNINYRADDGRLSGSQNGPVQLEALSVRIDLFERGNRLETTRMSGKPDGEERERISPIVVMPVECESLLA